MTENALERGDFPRPPNHPHKPIDIGTRRSARTQSVRPEALAPQHNAGWLTCPSRVLVIRGGTKLAVGIRLAER
jgi:hypothetical protein